MKFAMVPEVVDEIASTLADHGHELVSAVDEAEVLVLDGGPDNVPDPLPASVQLIHTQFAGIDPHVKAGVVQRSGVRWANAAGLYADTVAESTLGLLLAVYHQHKVAALAKTWNVRSRVDSETRYLIKGKTVAVVGAGGIGKELIRVLTPFGCEILAVNRSGRDVPGANRTVAFADASDVWSQADVFVLITPLTDDTYQLVNTSTLEKMKPNAVVINVGRGPLVDTNALTNALRDGQIAGAGLDVTDPEPLPDDHPLWDIDTCVITPHTANTRVNINATVGEHIAQNLARFQAGEELLTEVDVEAGY